MLREQELYDELDTGYTPPHPGQASPDTGTSTTGSVTSSADGGLR